MQGKAKRRAITSPVAAGFYEGRPGEARRAPEGVKPSHTTNVLISFYLDFDPEVSN